MNLNNEKSVPLSYSASFQDLHLTNSESNLVSTPMSSNIMTHNFKNELPVEAKQRNDDLDYNDIDDNEPSPKEETLTYKPARLDPRGEIINIQSDRGHYLTDSDISNALGYYRNRNFNGNYEFNSQNMSRGLQINSDPQFEYDRDFVQSPFQHASPQDQTSSDYQRRHDYIRPEEFRLHRANTSHSLLESQNAPFNLSSSMHQSKDASKFEYNKPADFENKRQKVLERKEMLEKQRKERLEQKIKEKEEKFK